MTDFMPSKHTQERVKILQEYYTIVLQSGQLPPITSASSLSRRLQHVYEYFTLNQSPLDQRYPFSMAWIAEQVIGAMYEVMLTNQLTERK